MRPLVWVVILAASALLPGKGGKFATFLYAAALPPPQQTAPAPELAGQIVRLEKARVERPGDLKTLEDLAISYTMAGNYNKAAAVIREMLGLTASDPARHAALQLQLARNLAWGGETGRAIRAYEIYLKTRPGDRDATIELIRIRRYRGDYAAAEKLCDRLLAARPDDPEVLALKAEVLHWAGNRRLLARRTAERAVQLAPDLPDARVAHVYALGDLGERRAARREFGVLAGQVARRGRINPQASYGDAFRLLEQDLAHPFHVSTQPVASIYNDSDGIHNIFSGLQFAAPLFDDHELRLDIAHFRSSAPLASLFTAGRESSRVSEFTAGGAFRAPAVYVTLRGGGSWRSNGGAARPIFDFAMSASPFDRWTFDFSACRDFLKVTPRAMDLDISSYRLGAGLQYAFDARTSVAARADRRYWSDDNRSIGGDAILRRVLRYHKPFMIDAGTLTHWEQFARDTRFASGFFTPDQYRRHDGFLGLHGELGRRFIYEIRGAAGAQKTARAADYRPSWEVTTTATLLLSRSLELGASYQRRNYSLLSRDGWYHGFFFSLRLRP